MQRQTRLTSTTAARLCTAHGKGLAQQVHAVQAFTRLLSHTWVHPFAEAIALEEQTKQKKRGKKSLEQGPTRHTAHRTGLLGGWTAGGALYHSPQRCVWSRHKRRTKNNNTWSGHRTLELTAPGSFTRWKDFRGPNALRSSLICCPWDAEKERGETPEDAEKTLAAR